MKVLISIQHPAHVHFFRNSIKQLQNQGHKIKVLAREKEFVSDLLDHYNIDHTIIVGKAKNKSHLAILQAKYEWGIYKVAQEFEPDLLTAIAEPSVAHVSRLTDTISYIFTDTEHASLQNKLAFPFANRIYTPDCYEDNIGEKQVRYPSYHELAYLHPDRFSPDDSVLDEAGLDKDDKFVILRLVSWGAIHDIGDSGFENVVDVVSALESTGAKVLISSEAKVPKNIQHCKANIPSHKMHDLMYYADLFIGESSTMASESAVLGTPAIFVSSSRRGYTDEIEEEYGLVFNHDGPDRQENGLKRALDILQNHDPEIWKSRRKALLDDKIDTTEFILEQIINV